MTIFWAEDEKRPSIHFHLALIGLETVLQHIMGTKDIRSLSYYISSHVIVSDVASN
jgi:hypothetical protein